MKGSAPGQLRDALREASLKLSDGQSSQEFTGESLESLGLLGRISRLRIIESAVAVVLLIVLAGDGWAWMLGGAAVYGIVAAITAMRAPTVSNAVHFLVVVALVLMCVLGVVVPALYVATVAVGATLVAAAAAFVSSRSYVLITSILAVGLIVSGWRDDPVRSVLIAGLVVAVLTAHGRHVVEYRSHVSDSVADSLRALRTAGAITHLVDLTTGRYVDANGDIEGQFGWSKQEWVSADHSTLVHPEDLEDYWIDPEMLEVGQSIDRSCRYLTKDGSWVWIRETSRVIEIDNHKHIHGFMVDVTAQRAGLDRAKLQATTDELTGLLNRRALLTELDNRAGQTGHHLVLIDLDGFKEVNDTLGHGAGDRLLGTLAERLRASVRPEDVVARLGGDEFAIVLDDVGSTTRVSAMVDRIAFEVSLPVSISGRQLVTRMSAGIVRATSEMTSSDILRHADLAMYTAKRAGQSWTIFDEDLAARFEDRVKLTSDVCSAIEDGHLLLHFQPIVDIDTGAAVAFEGLARWNHPDRGLLLPADFLDLLLDTERAQQFTCEMVMQAWDMGKALAAAGHPVPVAVNVPVGVLQDPDFLRWFDDFMGRARTSLRESDAAGYADGVRLTFEVAERELHDLSAIAEAIHAFVERGVAVAVDDFGTGHATFERLRWQHVEQLKFDTDIVQGAACSDRERSILRSMLALADELDYDVVAEGVETEAQLEALKSLGFRRVQGFWFAQAMRSDDAVRYASGDRVFAQHRSTSTSL